MHRDEAARILGEVLGGDEAAADRGHLELELDELRIEQVEQDVVGSLAVDLRQLEAFVVQPLLHASLGRDGRDLVVFVGRLLHVIHRRGVARAERRRDHLRDADVFGPGDALVLRLPELAHAEVSSSRTSGRDRR